MYLESATHFREGDLVQYGFEGNSSWWYLLKKIPNGDTDKVTSQRKYVTFLMLQMYVTNPVLNIHNEIVRYTFCSDNIDCFKIISRSEK